MKIKWGSIFISLIMIFTLLIGCSEEVIYPSAKFSFDPSSPSVSDVIKFDASESNAGSSDTIVEFHWDFNNDSIWDDTTGSEIYNKQFDKSGTYEVVLRVRSNQGYTSVENAMHSVTVEPDPGGGGSGDETITLDFPPNNRSDVSLLPTFSWSVNSSNNLRYDIYLGTSQNLETAVAENLDKTSYIPSDSLQKNTKYYWRVRAYDGVDVDESSSTWQFTTQLTDEEANKPPNKPTAPYPAPLSENRSVNPFLEWSCSDPNGDELTYEVYFKDSEPPDTSGSPYYTTSLTQFEPGTLNSNTTYYWKIIAIDPDGEKAESELWYFITGAQSADCLSSFTDERDNKTYTTVQVGVQCWMAENLDYGEMLASGSATDNNLAEKFCYEGNENNCTEYGGLYQWNELMQYTQVEEVGGICPDGWHVPSENEWHYLVDHQGGNFAAGKRLKKGGSSGFEALLAGVRNTSSNYDDLGLKGYYWTSTQLNTDKALLIHFDDNLDGVFFNHNDKDQANSLRCVKD